LTLSLDSEFFLLPISGRGCCESHRFIRFEVEVNPLRLGCLSEAFCCGWYLSGGFSS
jgi:hypothetical protein